MLVQYAIQQSHNEYTAGKDAFSKVSAKHAALRFGAAGISWRHRAVLAVSQRISLVHTPMQVPIRYVGVFTDGGAGNSLQQFGSDNMCAQNFLELTSCVEKLFSFGPI